MTRRYRLVPIPKPAPVSRHGIVSHPETPIPDVEAAINAVVDEYDRDVGIEWLGVTPNTWGLDGHALMFEVTTYDHPSDDQTRRAVADAALPAPIDEPLGSVMVAVDRAWLVDVLADAQTYSGDDHVRGIPDRARPVLIVDGRDATAVAVYGREPADTPLPTDPTVLDRDAIAAARRNHDEDPLADHPHPLDTPIPPTTS